MPDPFAETDPARWPRRLQLRVLPFPYHSRFPPVPEVHPFAHGRQRASEVAHIPAALERMHILVTIPLLHRMRNGNHRADG